MNQDTSGRPWATVAETKVGSKLVADNGFDCIKSGSVLEVQAHEGDLFIPCTKGKHFLDGQLSRDESHYVGLYPYVG